MYVCMYVFTVHIRTYIHVQTYPDIKYTLRNDSSRIYIKNKYTYIYISVYLSYGYVYIYIYTFCTHTHTRARARARAHRWLAMGNGQWTDGVAVCICN